jgi:hypothetical protein
MMYRLVHHGGTVMNRTEIAILLFAGIAIWVLGTIYFSFRGQAILETTSIRYWLSFTLTPILSAILCACILKLLHIPAAHWTSAMLLLALPGMVGEAILLTHFAAFMPRLQIASSGRYGALLFATYFIALGFAEAITLRAQ